MVGKESRAGTKFYASVGLKSVTVHLPKEIHLRLTAIAKKQDRSLQKTIRRVLVEYANKH